MLFSAKKCHNKDMDFEKTLNKLEAVVKKMEAGKLSLEQSLKQFETGIELTRKCQLALSRSEKKVDLLIEENDALLSAPFDLDEESEEDEEDE